MKFLKNLEHTSTVLKGYLHKTYEGFQTINDMPYIGYRDNVFTEFEMNQIIENAQPALDLYDLEELVYFYPPKELYAGQQERYKNNKQTYTHKDIITVDPDPYDQCAVTRKVKQTVSNLVKQPLENLEPIYCGKYSEGGKFEEHSDAFDYPSMNPEVKQYGQRIISAILYCNDNFTGGETVFPHIDYSVKPKTGRLLVFHNVHRTAYKPTHTCYHLSKSIITGTKYVCVFCWRICAVNDSQLNIDTTQKLEYLT
jgi:hypothetical protein